MKPNRTHNIEQIQKHQLVLQSTSWCFRYFWPFFTSIKSLCWRSRRLPATTIDLVRSILKLQLINKRLKLSKQLKSTSWCFGHFWPGQFWHASGGSRGVDTSDRQGPPQIATKQERTEVSPKMT